MVHILSDRYYFYLHKIHNKQATVNTCIYRIARVYLATRVRFCISYLDHVYAAQVYNTNCTRVRTCIACTLITCKPDLVSNIYCTRERKASVGRVC